MVVTIKVPTLVLLVNVFIVFTVKCPPLRLSRIQHIVKGKVHPRTGEKALRGSRLMALPFL